MSFNKLKSWLAADIEQVAKHVRRLEAEFTQSDWSTMIDELAAIEFKLPQLFERVAFLNSYDDDELESL